MHRFAGLLFAVGVGLSSPAAARELILEGTGEVVHQSGPSRVQAGDSVGVWISIDLPQEDLEPTDGHFGLYVAADTGILVLSVGTEFARIVCEDVTLSVADDHPKLRDAINVRGDWCVDSLGVGILGVDLILHDDSQTVLDSDAVPRPWPELADFAVSGVSWEGCSDAIACGIGSPEIGVTAILTALPEPDGDWGPLLATLCVLGLRWSASQRGLCLGAQSPLTGRLPDPLARGAIPRLPY